MKLLFTFLSTLLLIIIFSSCQENTTTESTQKEEKALNQEAYLQKGKLIASSTFATLSAELGKALQEGGVAQAIEKCNLAAMPLVDSLSEEYGAEIRRTSLKVRNPENKASREETMILKAYENQVREKAALQPMVVENPDQTVFFYAPIKIQELCLNCHGKVGEELKKTDHELIQTLYPADEATGYVLNDLRGMWSIKFKKDK